MAVKTLIIPVAGMGTRFLPATKCVPKEMLPILDKPLLHYAINEAKLAGIKSFVFVTNPENKFPKLFLSKNAKLEKHLKKKKNKKMLKLIKELNLPAKNIHLVNQRQPLGLGDAVNKTKKYVGKDDFAVLLPDDLILGKNCLKELIQIYEKKNASVIGVMDVNIKDVQKYGVIEGKNTSKRTSMVFNLVEKPKPKDAPSSLAVVGRYILKNSIFNYLSKITKGAGNEIQLTDAISMCAKSENVYYHRFSGKRYDCGSKLGFLKAQIACALQDPDIKKLKIIKEIINDLTKGKNK